MIDCAKNNTIVFIFITIVCLSCNSDYSANDDSDVFNQTNNIDTMKYSDGSVHFKGEIKNGKKFDTWKEYNQKGDLISAKFYSDDNKEYTIDLNDYKTVDTTIILKNAEFQISIPNFWILDKTQQDNGRLIFYKPDSTSNYFPRISIIVENKKGDDFENLVKNNQETIRSSVIEIKDMFENFDGKNNVFEWIFSFKTRGDLELYTHQLSRSTAQAVITVSCSASCDVETRNYYRFKDVFYLVLSTFQVY